MRTSLLFILLACLLPTWALSQCSPAFFDGFESGAYTPTWTIGSGLTSGAVTTTNPSTGLYRLEGTGGTSSHLTGFNTTIPSATPTQISWDVYPTGTGASNYVVAGDAAVTATNCIMFCYWQGGTNLRFVSSSTAIYTCPPNAWYHIELRNINWTTHIFDIYINNTLVQAAFPFRSASVNSISRIHLYNFNSAVGVWDNIQVGLANAPVTTTMVTNAACNGNTNGMIDLSVTGGSPGYTYLWSNGATTQDLNGIGAGNYTVTVTDIATCSTTTNVVVTQPTPLVLSNTFSNLTCNGSADGAIDNTASGGTAAYGYLWSTGDTTQDLSGQGAGTYTVTLTDANNCTSVDTLTLTQPAAIVIDDSITMPSCNGDTDGVVLASPSGGSGAGYTYFWSTGSITNMSGSVGAGTYMIMVTDGAGCSEVDSITVSEPALLTVTSATSNPLCNGDSTGNVMLTPAGGTPAYTYLWSNGATTQTLSGVGVGAYSVMVMDASGCMASDSVSLTEPSAIVASGVATDAVGVNNGSVDLTASGGTGNLSYLWSNGATTQDISGLGAGSYTVTITDANGCTNVLSFGINLVISAADAFPVGVTVSPNPFANTFTVRLAGLGNESAQLSLIDLQGRVLWMQENVSQANVVAAPEVASGVYFLRVQIGDHSKTLRLMRQ
jgi:SprB repeat/Secretion system C-terminal sorting domain